MKRLFALSAIPAALGLFAFTTVVTSGSGPEPFMKKGNKFEYDVTLKSGEKEIAAMSIQSVTVEAGRTVIIAKDQRKYPSGKNQLNAYRLRYIHDSLNWSQDVLNLLDVTWGEDGPEWTRKSDSLIYPYDMKVGDTLRFATGSELYKGKTSGFTNRYITVSDRKVVAKEDVQIGTETVSAFRIDAKMNQSKVVNFGDGKDRNYKGQADLREWFSPTMGIVKSEWRTGKDTIPTVSMMRPMKK